MDMEDHSEAEVTGQRPPSVTKTIKALRSP